jgi:hypothetical protein
MHSALDDIRDSIRDGAIRAMEQYQKFQERIPPHLREIPPHVLRALETAREHTGFLERSGAARVVDQMREMERFTHPPVINYSQLYRRPEPVNIYISVDLVVDGDPPEEE